MTARHPAPSPEERPDPETRAWTPPHGDRRRTYRPEETPEEPAPIFTDWASI